MTQWQLRQQQRLGRDVYIGAGTAVTPEVRARAALLNAPPGAVVAGHTAARLWGGVVPLAPAVRLVLRTGRTRAQGIDGRRGAATTTHDLRGKSVLSPAATFCDLGPDLDLLDLVILGDSLIKAGAVTVTELRDAAEAVPMRAQHRARTRCAAYLVRGGVDSPMETRLRLLIVLAGLPEPVVNHVEYRDDGTWLRRFDLAYPEAKLAIEYDGRQHAESTRQWEHDVARREALDADGWRLVVVLAKDIYTAPAKTLYRIRKAMVEVGLRPPPPSDDWRLPFAG